MEDYLEEIEGWMEQVRDEDVSVEEYDFLNRLAHRGSANNGNNGVANVGAYLAIYREDGELQVDEELVEALDEQQAEEYSGRNRISNIVHDPQTQKREDNTLYDKGVDGHEVLLDWIGEFIENADWRDAKRPNEFEFNHTTSQTKPNTNNGGDNKMTSDREFRTAANTRRFAVRATAEALYDAGASVDEAVEVADEAYDAFVSAKGDLQEARETLKDTLDQDADMFAYTADALNNYDEALQDEVVDTLEDIEHDDYDLTAVRNSLRVAERRWDHELPDDPDDLLDNA